MERKLLLALLTSIVVVAAFLVTQNLVSNFTPDGLVSEEPAFSGSADNLLNRLEDAYQIMKSNFYEPERINEAEALSAGLRGMVQYIRDPENFDNDYVTAFVTDRQALLERDKDATSYRNASDTDNEQEQESWQEILDKISDLNTLELDQLKLELDETYGGLDPTDPNFDYKKHSDGAIVDAGIRTMVAALEDPYSRYNTWEEYRDFTTDLNGEEYEGIGAFIESRNDNITISSPIRGGPAEAAGVRAGDVILTINGESTRGFTTSDASTKLRGNKGTDVVIEVRRSTGQIEEIKITRDRIKVPSATASLVDPQIGMVSINRFGNSTTQEVKEALAQLESESAEIEGLIIDLRNNGGGYLTTARDIASLFIDRGNTVVIQRERENEFKFPSTGNMRDNLPIAVLINRGTASASEILGGAIRDNNMGILVGEQSFGKGVIQTPLRLGDESRMILTTAEYLTPDGHPVQEIGLTPAPGFAVESWVDTYFNVEFELSKLASIVLYGINPSAVEGAFSEYDVSSELADNRLASAAVIKRITDQFAVIGSLAVADQYEDALNKIPELWQLLETDVEVLLNESGEEIAEGEVEAFREAYADFLAEMGVLMAEVEDRLTNNALQAAIDWLKSDAIIGTTCPCEFEFVEEAVSSDDNAESN